ncbi:MAG: hypothetical protein KDD22_07095, partial [Bdellovibrionales bacterium]|nr:hypothetical protein [Bdellovibrionales bacterium]
PVKKGFPEIKEKVETYLENVVLPGVYKLPELLEFKWVLALMMAAFILIVTSLSTIPLLRILRDSIEKESQQHAMTLASNLAQINRPALMSGQQTAVSVDLIRKRPGVKEALIISNIDGNIIAPANRAGSYPDMPFIHQARLNGKADVSQVSDSSVIAVAPIEFFNAETGTQAVTAYAVVAYDMSTLAVDDGKTLSLFIQTLFIALIVGMILFFFIYKMIEYPLKTLNSQLDTALREGQQDVITTYDFPALQSLTSNINSALSRVGQEDASHVPVYEQDRNQELAHLVDLIGFPALALLAEGELIAHVNPGFEDRTGLTASTLMHQNLSAITDQALKLSVQDLLERAKLDPSQLHSNEIEFSGESYQVALQAVMGSQKVAYFVVVLLPMDAGGGEA